MQAVYAGCIHILMGKYIEPERLKELILEARRLKTLTPELCEVVVKIASGVHSRYCYRCDLDDFQQDAILAVWFNIGMVDLNGSPFNYLTCMVISVHTAWYRQQKRERKKLEEYRHVID